MFEELVKKHNKFIDKNGNVFYITRCTTSEMWAGGKKFVNENHSYIKWSDRPSRKLYWLLYENNKLCGVFGLGSAYSNIKVVKDWMLNKQIKFNELANNIVYCLSKTNNKNSGTIFLSLCRKDAIKWWFEKYKDKLKAFQTFILPPRTGALYKADNWVLLGRTSGGITQTTKTIQFKNLDVYPKSKIQKKIFKSGEIKYLLRDFKTSEPKLIFVKLTNV